MKTDVRRMHRVITVLWNVTGTALKNMSTCPATAFELVRADGDSTIITGSDINPNYF